jgi:hypothetical protein
LDFLGKINFGELIMANRVDLQASLSFPRNDGGIGPQARDGVSYRVGVAVLAALAWVLAITLLDRSSPRQVNAEAQIFYGP